MTYPSPLFLRSLISKPRLGVATLLLAVLAPRAAAAVQSAELYRTQAYFYGRFEARVRFAPGEGVVSSFFLWKDGSSSTTSWNELDYEKINSTCHLQTNIWTGTGTQSAMLNTPTFNICSDYHTYAFEWTPDYIAWLIDGTQIRKVTGASVTEYTKNASQGMTIHFNIWAGNSGFGGTLDPSILPVHQYISWVQYSSYANSAFQQQWREEFTGSTLPSGWAVGTWASPYNLSTHNPANVTYANGIAVLSMTADNATGFTGTPPADPAGGTGGTSGTGGAGGAAGGASGSTGRGGAGGSGGSGGTTGGGGRGGAAGSASPGTGGSSSPGSGGSGAGGTTAGAAGSGAGGAAAGIAGNGAGGAAAGTAGSGAGGASTGAAGSGVSGTGGASATGGDGQNPSGTGGSGIGGGPGQAGSTGQAGGGGGCACDIGSANGDRALTGLLLLAAVLGTCRRRSGRRIRARR